jgi:hypothetical protein
MKAAKKLWKSTRKVVKKIARRIEELALAYLRTSEQRPRTRAGEPPRPGVPAHADERTARRIAEAEHGGLSSAESAARWERGDNPGGTHHRSVRREGPEHLRPSQDEPQDRKEREPGGERHMAATRRGA